jgi:hypothetical protein
MFINVKYDVRYKYIVKKYNNIGSSSNYGAITCDAE